MVDVSRYYTQDTGDDTIILIEDSNGKTISVTDSEAIQLIKELFKALGDKEQHNIAVMFQSRLNAQGGN